MLESAMKVLFVCNNVYIRGNGLTTSVRQTIKALRNTGAEVRLLCGENADPNGPSPDYKLKIFKFPIFQPLIDANCYSFAAGDKKVIRKAVEWADVIHLEEAMVLQLKVVKIAEELGKPMVGTFHLYTENIFYNIFGKAGEMKFANKLLMRFWRNHIYNHCSYIQCPAEKVRLELMRAGFKSQLEVFSNGIRFDNPIEESVPQTSPFIILSIGRFSPEKNHDEVIEAMKYCRHAGDIQLYFAGKGSGKAKYERKCNRLLKAGILKHQPVFGFYHHEELCEMRRKAYLYVHCANIEVEGLSCLESIREGLVPVIADARLAATSGFALCPESVFPHGDIKALAERIDWWIEHPEYRKEMSAKYALEAREYSIEHSAERLLQMYGKAIREKKQV